MKIVYILVCLLFVKAGHAQEELKLKKIDSLLRYYEKQQEFMGTVALSNNGKVIFNKSYGYSNYENGSKSDPETKYRIGSVTKMYTATMIMQLIEEKKLSLDHKLSKWFPNIPNAAIISIDNMLNHNSGIFSYTSDEDFSNTLHVESDRKGMTDMISRHPSAFEPGTRNEYSNSNYLLLGYIIEDITGKSFEENLKSRIIKKLGLKRTSYGGKTAPSANEAFSYRLVGSKWEAEKSWAMTKAGAAGAVISSTADALTFIDALFAGKLIGKASLDKMMEINNGFGRGMFKVPFYNSYGYGHTGRIEEFISQLNYFPIEKTGLAIFSNAQGKNNNDIAIGVLSYYFGQPFTFPNLEKIVVADALLDQYVGVYSSPTFPLKITIRKDGGSLIAHATGQGEITLKAENDTTFSYKMFGVEVVFSPGKLTLKQGPGENVLTKE